MSATDFVPSSRIADSRAHARGVRALLPLAVVAVVAAALTVFAVLSTSSTIYWQVDFLVYRAGGDAVVHGVPLYDMVVHTPAFPTMQFTYTPFAALLFVPLSLFGSGASGTLWLFLNFLALGAAIWLALRSVDSLTRRQMLMLTVVGMAIASRLDPVWSNNQNGQINVLVMLLVLLDFSPVLPKRWRGLAIGLAAGLKLTPLIFVVYLLFTKRGREAGRACLAFAGSVALGFAILPGDSASYWFGGLFMDSQRIVSVSDVVINHSLSGLFARLSHSPLAPTWVPAISVAVAILGLTGAVWAHRRGQDRIGLLVAAFTALLVSPVSWPHHFVWIVPALVWLGFAAWRAKKVLAAVIIATAGAFFLNPIYPPLQQTDGNGEPVQWTTAGEIIATLGGYLTITALALALLPVWLPRLSRIPEPTDRIGDPRR
jgi:alpha-1,2-mannosyltransferase